MNLRVWTVVTMGTLAIACGSDDSTGTTSDDVTVHPTGTTTLGDFALKIPASVANGTNNHALQLDLVPAPGQRGGDVIDTDPLQRGESIRVLPGTYCLQVKSFHRSSTLGTSRCNIAIKPGEKTTLSLSSVTANPDDLALLANQGTLTGGVTAILLGDGAKDTGTLELRPQERELAALPGKVTVTLQATGASWAPTETTVPEDATVPLNLPKEDKVLVLETFAEATTLPEANAGMTWHWKDPPPAGARYASPQPIGMGVKLRFFAGDPGEIIFDLGGIEHSFSLDKAGGHVAYARRLEVTDVTDTDDQGHAQTIRGSFGVKQNGKRLSWPGGSFFATGRSVMVWNGDYTVDVTYVANGIAKSYTESVHVE